MPEVILRNATIGYKDKAVISNVNITFKGPGIYLILGRNGSGKTTLLKTIGGLLRPLGGVVSVVTNGGLVEYVPQERDFNTDFPLTVLEYLWVNYTLRKGLLPTIRISRYFINEVKKLVLELGLREEIIDLTLSELSSGESKLVMIAKALIVNPDVVLLDEPYSSIDHINTPKLTSIINKLGSNRLVIITSHDRIPNLKYLRGIGLIDNHRLTLLNSKLLSDSTKHKLRVYKVLN